MASAGGSRAIAPQVTIAIPTYNRAELLRDAIQSGLLQRNIAVEVLVVDDASTDRTSEVVASFSDPRLRYIRQPRNVGLVQNFYTAYAAADAPYVWFLHDDDTLARHACETLCRELDEDPTAAAVFSDHWIVDSMGIRLDAETAAVAAFFGRDRIVAGRLLGFARPALIERCLPLGSCLFRRSAMRDEWFSPNAALSLDLWIAYCLTKSGLPVRYSADRLMFYRRHSGGATATSTVSMAESMLTIDRRIVEDEQLAEIAADATARFRSTQAGLIRSLIAHRKLGHAWRITAEDVHGERISTVDRLLAMRFGTTRALSERLVNRAARLIDGLTWREAGRTAHRDVSVLLVEPYGGGHHERTVADATAAFDAVGVQVAPVTAASAWRQALVEKAARAASKVLHRGGVRSARALRVGDRYGERWWGALGAQCEAFVRELPWLWSARRDCSRLRRGGHDPVVVILSSYVRPLWIKRLLLAPNPVTETVFDELTRPERHARGARSMPLLPTTHRIASTALQYGARGRIRTLCHHPLLGIPGSAVSSDAEIGADVATLIADAAADGTRTSLCFGVLHGKKDSQTAFRAARLLPAGERILIVGDPAYEGRHLPEDIKKIVAECPQIQVLLRSVTDAERDYLFSRADRILIPQQPSISSMSGSLVDAVRWRKPVIATAGTATGDSTEALGIGRTYESRSPASLAAAICDAPAASTIAPQRYELAREGLLGSPDWAEAVLDLVAKRSPTAAERVGDSRGTPRGESGVSGAPDLTTAP